MSIKHLLTTAALLLTVGCAPQNIAPPSNPPHHTRANASYTDTTATQPFWSGRRGLGERKTNARDALPATDLWQRINSAGELNARYDNPRIDRYREWYRDNQAYFDRVMQWSPLYLHYVVSELTESGLPLELALLPFIESAYNPFAVSPSNASGLWQFIPQTADIMGLTTSPWYDGRKDILDSTQAALRYLAYLHGRFNEDWLLALAAYNGGEGVVRRAMQANSRAGKPTDFWSLPLSDETRAYVPQFLALAEVMREPAKYGVVVPSIADKPYFTTIDARAPINLGYMAKISGIDADTMQYLNPGYRQQVTLPNGSHRILIPSDAAPLFLARLDRLDHRLQAQASDAAQSSSTESQTNGPTATLLAKAPNATQTNDYIVKEGDNLWRIGRRFKVDSNLLARNNKLIPTAILRPGQVLVIAQRGNQPQTVRQVNYEVQPGDSLFNISRTFQIAIRDILQWNDLRTHNLLVPGQQLKLFLRL